MLSTRLQRGFTLVEMLACMAIIIVLFSLGAAASGQWGRRARMRSAAHEVKSALDTARQWAMTHQARARFRMDDHDDRARYWIESDRHAGPLGTTNALARGIVWTNSPATVIHFKPDGVPEIASNITIVITESARRTRPLISTVLLYRTTGHAEIQ